MYKRDYVHNSAINEKHDQSKWDEYRRLCNEVTLMIQKAKAEYYDELERELNDNPKTLSTIMKKFTNNDNKSITCMDITANEFNNYFSTVGHETAANLDKDNNTGLWKNPDCIHTFKFETVKADCMIKLLKTLSLHSSLDVFTFDCKLLCLSAELTGPALSTMLNLSINSGEIPRDWKFARCIKAKGIERRNQIIDPYLYYVTLVN